MADLLSHVLIAYALTLPLVWAGRVSRRWVPIAMGGAAIPDLVKIELLLDSGTVENALGVPFSFDSLGTLAGVLLVSGVVAVLFARDHRRRVYLVACYGGSLSLLVDGLRVWADGYAGFWLYPLWVRLPSPNLYVSSDPRVLVAVLAVAGAVAAVDRFTAAERPGSSSP